MQHGDHVVLRCNTVCRFATTRHGCAALPALHAVRRVPVRRPLLVRARRSRGGCRVVSGCMALYRGAKCYNTALRSPLAHGASELRHSPCSESCVTAPLRTTVGRLRGLALTRRSAPAATRRSPEFRRPRAVWLHIAAHCNTIQRDATRCNRGARWSFAGRTAPCCCTLQAVCCSSSHCMVSVHCMLHAARYLLPLACCRLHLVRCILFLRLVRCMLHVACCAWLLVSRWHPYRARCCVACSYAHPVNMPQLIRGPVVPAPNSGTVNRPAPVAAQARPPLMQQTASKWHATCNR